MLHVLHLDHVVLIGHKVVGLWALQLVQVAELDLVLVCQELAREVEILVEVRRAGRRQMAPSHALGQSATEWDQLR